MISWPTRIKIGAKKSTKLPKLFHRKIVENVLNAFFKSTRLSVEPKKLIGGFLAKQPVALWNEILTVFTISLVL